LGVFFVPLLFALVGFSHCCQPLVSAAGRSRDWRGHPLGPPGTAPIVFGASCDNAATVTLVMKGTAWFSVGCSH